MGRGAYDTSDPFAQKSAMGGEVLHVEEEKRADREEAAMEAAAQELDDQLRRSKKSRGIRAAKRAEREAALQEQA